MAFRALISLGAGLLAFLSPCVLPLMPGYVAYMTGGGAGERVPLRRAFPGVLAFVAGLSVVFISLGASASVVSALLNRHKRGIEIGAGVFIVLMGLAMVAGRRARFLQAEKRFHVAPDVKPPRVFLLGVAFAFGWTPCIGPTLGAALNLAATSSGLASGVALLGAYALGLGVPFALAGLGLFKVGTKLRRHAAKIQIAGGAVLIGIGLLVATGRLTLITIWLQRMFGRVGLNIWNV